jgi:hypothetical protein
MKTSQTQPRGKRQLGELLVGMALAAPSLERSLARSLAASLAAPFLAALALCACHASAQADASLQTGQNDKEQIRDFDRPLEPAQTKAEAVADEGPRSEYALLGARHDLNYAGAATPSCQCLAVALSGSASDAAFQWEMGVPQLNPDTQQVIAFTSNGVSCEAPPTGTLGASYQGYTVEGNDVVVFVEALGEGRPLTSGGIIPRPLGNGAVFVEPAGAIYGKPLEGKGKRCKLTPSAAPASNIFQTPPAGKASAGKAEGANDKAEPASKP